MALNTGEYWQDYQNRCHLSDEELKYFKNADWSKCRTNKNSGNFYNPFGSASNSTIEVNALENSWKRGAEDYWNKLREEYANMIKPLTTDLQANQDAGSQAEQTAQTDSISANLAGINAGMNSGRAGLLGDVAGNNNINAVTNAAYQNSVSNAGKTQQDYLAKMGCMDAMNCCAQNLQNAQGLNIASGILQGAGTGAKLGAGL